MPHGHSWWSLIPAFNEYQAQLREAHGPSWIAHAPLSLQYVATLAMLLVFFVVAGLMVKSKVSDTSTDESCGFNSFSLLAAKAL